MSSEVAIQVHGVGKAYRIWNSPASRIISPFLERCATVLPPQHWSTALRRRAAAHYRDFWALRGITFQVKKGESTGIVGRNGSGKSTLLQIIAGTLQPTQGQVHLSGRVAALLELGSGFNPEFTGRENVYLNGTVLGMSRREIEEKFDDIAAFADIGEFLDQPVKTYSSGMMIRLAFAVAVSVDPEVLIVDEALSVGDIFFQQKCFKRVHAMLERGVSLLFVSHDTAAVQNLCNHALLLSGGEAVYAGPPEEAASRYFTMGSARPAVASLARPVEVPPKAVPSELRETIVEHDFLKNAHSRHGAREVELAAAAFRVGSVHGFNVKIGLVATLDVLVRAHTAIDQLSVGIHLFDRMNNLVFATGSRQLGVPLRPLQAEEERVIRLELTLSVQPGEYTFSLGCAQPSPDGVNVGFLQDRCEGLGPINVYADAETPLPFYGIAQLPLRITECQ